MIVTGGAWGSDPDNVWIVGGDGKTDAAGRPIGSGIVYHWDGASISHALDTPRELYAVWGSSASNVWAMGLGGDIWHFNGTKWEITSPNVVADSLRSVWLSNEKEGWAVGDRGVLLYWNGSYWSPGNSPAVPLQTNLTSVWGNGTDEVWVVGEKRTIMKAKRTEGFAWVMETNFDDLKISPLIKFNSIWANGANVFVVGERATIVRRDGASWIRVDGGNIDIETSNDRFGICGANPSKVWFIGYNANALSPVILRKNLNSGVDATFNFASNVRLTKGFCPSEGDVWSTGSLGNILRYHVLPPLMESK